MKRIMTFALGVLAVGCASYDGRGLVPGQSSLSYVEKTMGRAAEKRPAARVDTVYYFPQLHFGYATYAERIVSYRLLVAFEQRLSEYNIAKRTPSATRAEEVRDLLGPPFEPKKQRLT